MTKDALKSSSVVETAGEVEPLFVEGRWQGLHHHRLDPSFLAFLDAVRQGRMLATHCSRCDSLEIPPRPRCGRCMEETPELQEVGPNGRLLALTVLHMPMGGMEEIPGAIGAVQPDGASTGLLTRLTGADWSAVEDPLSLIGRRCCLKVVETPAGAWDDFWYEIDLNEGQA